MEGVARHSAVLGTIIGAIVTVTAIYYTIIAQENSGGVMVCKTKECVDAATRILNAMNESVDPCEEFYEYACGGWFEANPIPDDKSSINQFAIVEDSNAKALYEILRANYTNDRESIKKVKMYFRSCMDEESIEKLGAQPALNLLEAIGGMPLFGDKFNETDFSLEKYLAMMKSHVPDYYWLPAAALIAMRVKTDDKNSNRNVIKLDQPALGMYSRGYYLSAKFNSTRSAYRQYMEEFLEELWKSKEKGTVNGTNYNETTLKTAVDEIIELETKLAEILEPKANRMDAVAIYKNFTLKEMTQKVTSKFDWYTYVKLAMANAGITVKPTTEVVSYGTPYFKKFMRVIHKQQNRVIKNYIVWIMLHQNVKLLSKRFRDTKAVFTKAITGTAEEPPRWQSCVTRANDLLPMPLGALFVQNMFAEESKQVVEDMVASVFEVFKNDIPSLDWMCNRTKAAALVKVEAIGKLLGYPDYIIDENDPQLDQEYENLNISEENYFENDVNIYKFLTEKNLKNLEKAVDRTEWQLGPASVNAYYSATRNLIAFPAAILQPPFFDPDQPYAMNYGAIGMVIGHELTHGFDTMGSAYDHQGNLVNWWSNFSRNHFEEKAQCVRDQYSGFFYDTAQMFVNGNQTIGENIADLGGARLTYAGYQLWKKENAGKEFQLPGLEKFTSEQLLFLAHAQMWCNMERPEQAKNRITNYYHSPPQFRVTGPAKNLEEFGNAFGCKRGVDKMFPNQDETCRVW